MKYLKYLKSAIMGKKLFVILTIIQTIVIGTTSVRLANFVYETTYKERDLKRNTNVDIDKMYQLIIYGNLSGVRDFMNKIEATKEVGSYFYNNHLFEKNGKEEEVKTLEIDETMYKYLELEIVEGRGLEREDFEKDNIKRILLPKIYMNKFELNEIIDLTYDEEVKLKVIGFFKSDAKWLPDQAVEFLELRDISNIGISAYVKNDIEDVSFYDMTGTSTYIDDKTGNIKKVIKDIEDINKEYNYNFEMLSIKERIDRIREDRKAFIMQDMFFLIFAVVVALIGLILNILWTISVRKKEFGVRLGVGFSILDIQKLLIFENLIIGGIGVVIGMCISYGAIMKDARFLAEVDTGKATLSIIQLVVIFIMVSIMIIITSYLATKGLEKKVIKDMIGREE